MDILSITNKSSVSSDAKIYTKDGSDFVTTTFDALYKNSSAKTNIEKSVSDANARIDTTNNTVAELDNYARAKGNGIVLQSQGEMVTVNDSSDDYVVNLKPYGKTEQDSTTGAQLFYFNDGLNVTSSGVNAKDNGDGTLSVVGTTTLADGVFVLGNGFGGYDVAYSLKAGTYYVSNLPDGLGLYLYEVGYSPNAHSVRTKEGTITLNKDTDFVSVSLRWDTAGVTFNNNSVKIMLNKGSTALPWEPYTNGASPNPDYPQEIRSTVISEVRSCGKNQLENTLTSQTIQGVSFTVNNKDRSVTANGTNTGGNINLAISISLVEGENYIANGVSNGSISTYCAFVQDKSYTQNITITNGDAPFEAEYTEYIYTISVRNGATVNNVTFYPMIRLASVEDDTYEPYTETVATLSEPITLNAIPTDSDGNFTDSNGQQWIADYIDVAKGKVVRNIGKILFDGSQSIRTSTSDENTYRPAYTVTVYDTSAYKGRGLKALCDFFKYEYSLTTHNPNTFQYATLGGSGWSGESRIVFRFPIEKYSSQSAVNEYFSNNPTTVIYELKDEVEEDLPTADKIALRNLKTFYSVTHVMNDSEVKGEMVLSYNADTKMYIDNKFAELAAQLV